MITVANTGGLALGPLIGGFLATWAPAPLMTPYAVFAVLLALAAAVTLLAPETVRREGPRPPYRPQRFAMPPGSRAEFLGAAIAAFASFAIFGLFTSLAPTFVAGPMHDPSLLAAGLVTFSVFAAAVLSQVSLSRLPAGTQVICAVAAIVLGLAVLAAGAVATTLAVFVAGGIIAGLGDGTRPAVLGGLHRAHRSALAIGAILEVVAPTATLIGFAVATAALAVVAGVTLRPHTNPALQSPPEQISPSDQQQPAR